MPVTVIQETLARHGAWFPPAPTFTGALAGGIVATNAAGAATFRHGPVRPWVEELTVVLADGSELTVRRGEHARARASAAVPTASGVVDVPVPTYRMPDVVKRSAGYHAEPDMDLIDLFIGSEGTLGVITTVTFRALSPVPTTAMALVPCGSEAERDRAGGGSAPRAGGRGDRAHGRPLPRDPPRGRRGSALRRHAFRDGTALALLVQLELPPGTTEADAFDRD